MKYAKKLPWMISGLGLLAFGLRLGLYIVAVDEKNLLVSWHPLEIGLYLLLGAAVLTVALGVRSLEGSKAWWPNFDPSRGAFLGSLFFGAGLLATVAGSGTPSLLLDKVQAALGLAAGLGLFWAGWKRRQGEAPCFLLYCLVCLYLALYLVNHYQQWSSDPQLQDYLFSLLAVISMTLYAYEQAAFSLDMGNRRRLLATGLLGAFSAFAALGHTHDGLILLPGAVWCLTNLCLWEPLEQFPPDPYEEFFREERL